MDHDQPTALFSACASLDEAAVRAALASGADPNARDERGCTPLHIACNGAAKAPGRAAVAELLLQAGASPFSRDDAGNQVQPKNAATKALLAKARGGHQPRPILLFRGSEHPLASYFVEAMPESKPLLDKLCSVEFRVEGEARWPDPFSLVKETLPDVPFGVPIVLSLGLSWSKHEWVQKRMLQGDINSWLVAGGPHNDAHFDECWRALPRSREVLRVEDLRRMAPVAQRSESDTLDRLDRLLRAQSDYSFEHFREDHPAEKIARGEWQRRPERGVFQQGQARDVEIFQNLVSLLETDHNPVAEVLWGEFIEWNELDRLFARSVLHSGRLQAIEDVVGTNHVWLDAHAALRRWYSEQGVSERDQLRVALFSQRFCRNYRYQHDGGVAPTQGTGRELWVATRSVEQLVDALRPPRDRKDTLARLLWLLELGLPMPVFQARARALWKHLRNEAAPEEVEAVRAVDAGYFESWLAR